MKRKHLCLVGVLALAWLGPTQGAPLNTAVTYHGALSDAGEPADGQYDLRFALYDAAQDGVQIGPLVTSENVTVSKGQFVAVLDFGGAAFHGEFRWLEIRVRAAGAAVDFIPLSPRQPFHAVPYALYAPASGTAAVADTLEGKPAIEFAASDHVHSGTPNRIAKFTATGVLGDSAVHEISGRLGIGTTSPEAELQIHMRGMPIGFPTIDAPGLIVRGGLRNSGSALEIQNSLGTPMLTVEGSGAVAIGTEAAAAKLDVVNASGVAVTGRNSANGHQGTLGGSDYGVEGIHGGGGNSGYLGGELYGAYGKHESGNTFGALGYIVAGVHGQNGNGGTYGWLGAPGMGVLGRHEASGNNGMLGTADYGAYGGHVATGNIGHLATADYGVHGKHGATGNYGFLGGADYGVSGTNAASGNCGYLGGPRYGVLGKSYYESQMGIGVYGICYGDNGRAVVGEASLGAEGAKGVHGMTRSATGQGVYGESEPANTYGYLGGASGVYGRDSQTGNYGLLGNASYGAAGRHLDSGNYGRLGTSLYGVYGSAASDDHWAGYFDGHARITETLSVSKSVTCSSLIAATKLFQIDHPLDPENRYLRHATVESAALLNLYTGSAILDEAGQAIVQLPDWFEALNTEFQYQLTCIGGFAPVYIAEEIADNQFVIAGGTPALKVSWQVTGIRQDRFAQEHPLVVEEAKAGN